MLRKQRNYATKLTPQIVYGFCGMIRGLKMSGSCGGPLVKYERIDYLNDDMATKIFHLVDVQNREHLAALLGKLNAESIALWGRMKPQQMVEHLITQVQYTNGKREPFCEVPEEEARLAKQEHLYGSREIPRNLVLGVLPEELTYVDLPTAVRQLMTELENFDNYFNNIETYAIHGGFGPMDYQEWVIWHSKHFTHHLKQFGLIVV